MLVDIGKEEYCKVFRVDPNPFLSNKFIEINKSKVEKISWLVDDSNMHSLGLCLGEKNNCLFSPFSAPFGGFHFSHETIYIKVIIEYIQQLKKFIRDNSYNEIRVTLAPDIYSQTLNSKVIHSLLRERFEIKSLDITSWVDLELYTNSFKEKSSRTHLNQALKNELHFKLIVEQEEKIKAYELIRFNRSQFGRPIYMSFNDLVEINKIWVVNYFAVYNSEQEMLAASINYIAHHNIVYGVFWGDNEKGRLLRAMDFCIFNLYNHYKQEGYKYLDIGISTEEGVPNEGLLRFKETHEAITALRYTFRWTNDS